MSWVVWALLSALAAAATAILAKVGVRDVNSNVATALRTAVALVFAWGLVIAAGHLREVGQIGRRSLLFLLLSGLATGLSWVFYFRALQLGRASQVSAVDRLSLAMTIVFAAIFLGESVSWPVAAGAVLVVAGAALIAHG